MEHTKTYSFVIPHHNTPKLLERLINSIPIREDIEIIVIDDNSDEDKKAEALRSDIRVVYIDKVDSKGAGKARNIGISIASGKWILFADSDDFYKPGFINILDEYKNDNIDILFFNVESVDSDTLQRGMDRTHIEQRITLNYDGSESSTFDILYCRWGPWRKMLSLQYIKKYNLFYEEVPNGNDVLFSLQTSYFAKSWKVDKRVVYVLTYRQGSITYSTITKNKYTTALNNIAKRACFFKFIGHPEMASFWGRKEIAQSEMRYICSKLLHHPSIGIKILIYYLTHLAAIKKNSTYYIDVIKEIEKANGKE